VHSRSAPNLISVMSTESAQTREREPDDSQDGRSPKRTKLDDSVTDSKALGGILSEDAGSNDILPPSHVLLNTSRPTLTSDRSMHRIVEADVGISEYIARDVPKISGIIKQRYGNSMLK
jgi:tRNA pseudouridine13 synthase